MRFVSSEESEGHSIGEGRLKVLSTIVFRMLTSVVLSGGGRRPHKFRYSWFCDVLGCTGEDQEESWLAEKVSPRAEEA